MASRPNSQQASLTALAPTLDARIVARVGEAGLMIDRRAAASRRASGFGPRPVLDPLAASLTRTPEQVREARALRHVFLELDELFQDHRPRAGASDVAVRHAASRFRREVSLPSLVSFARCLDELGILL